MRSDDCAERILPLQALSSETASREILRFPNPHHIRLPDQQLHLTRLDHHATVQMSMAGRSLLQMEFGDGDLPPEPLQNDADLLFGGESAAAGPTDLSDDVCGHSFLLWVVP